MSQTLDIPDGTYDALKKAAEAVGTTPLGWIEARLAESGISAAAARLESRPGETLADVFAGKVGRIRSGVTEDRSQRVGEDFADYLEEKRRRGCL